MTSPGARRLRWAAAGLLGVALALQWVPVGRTNPPVEQEVTAPERVREILRRACYDCHSHETRWPWYSRVAPVSWWIVSHVNDARGDLNFSQWPVFDLEAEELAFHDIEEQITEGEMPLWSYTILHPEARLSASERETLLAWARSRP